MTTRIHIVLAALPFLAGGCTIFFDPSRHAGGDASTQSFDAGIDAALTDSGRERDSGTDASAQDAGGCGPGRVLRGGACEDIDGCDAEPCFPFVSCTDVPAPGTGRTCGPCPAGFAGDGATCTDVDGCAGDACFTGVTCSDVPAPGTGYTCGSCPAGYEGDGETCMDIDGCASGPCFAGVTCTDVPAPGTGYTCGDCPAGYQGDGITCRDIDGCSPPPCYPGVACTDVPAPATGFTCGSCPPGFTGDGITCRSIYCASSSDCDDGNPCTSDYCCMPPACPTATCSNSPSAFNTCDDADATDAEHCTDSGMCISVDKCDDGLACTTGSWNAGSNTCTFATSGCTCADYFVEGEEQAMVFRVSGSWSVPRGSVSHGGASVETSGSGGRVRTWILGTGVIVAVETGPNRGTFDVYVDGTLRGSFNAYASTFAFQQQMTVVSGLPFAVHTVEVVATSSGGGYVTLDYFRPICP